MATQTRAKNAMRVPLGMGVVVPCYKIIELLDSPDVKQNRDEVIKTFNPQIFILEDGVISDTPDDTYAKNRVREIMTINPSPLTAQTALICDSIYIEKFGKDILVGVYSNFYYVTSLPNIIKVAVYVRISGAPGTYDVDYRFVGPSDVAILPPKRSTVTLRPGHSYEPVSFVELVLHLQSVGPVKFQWKLRDRDWETLTSFEVKLFSPPRGAAEAKKDGK
jgi:hypothetical protein